MFTNSFLQVSSAKTPKWKNERVTDTILEVQIPYINVTGTRTIKGTYLLVFANSVSASVLNMDVDDLRYTSINEKHPYPSCIIQMSLRMPYSIVCFSSATIPTTPAWICMKHTPTQ